MSWISYLASTECGSDMKRKVDWDDEENEQSSMKLSEETSETEASKRTAVTRNHALKMF